MQALNKKTIQEALGRSPIHPFPARMAPGIALAALKPSDKPLTVLDPMVGSGTVLAVAASKGHKVIGVLLPAPGVRPDMKWMPELLHELLAFPAVKHDDQVDSISQFANWLAERSKWTIRQGNF